MSNKSEGDVQDRIREEMRSLGYWCLKVEVSGIRGYPDLMCFGHGRVFFIEVKKPGKKLRANQKLRKRQLNKAGIECEWFDSAIDARRWVENRWTH